MKWIKDFFKPRQNNFIRLLIRQAEYTVEGMEALESYMKKLGTKHAERVNRAEKEAGLAIKHAANARTSARIAEIASGCDMYHTENEYYPGQRYAYKLHGSPYDPIDLVKFTGSQWLAKSLYSDPDATPK